MNHFLGIETRLLRSLSVVLTAATLAVEPAHASSQTQAGDFLAAAIPVGTVAIELVRGDWDGALQYGLTFAAATASTEALKRLTKIQRPDGTNDKSFPSGHAARAFSSAAYVRQRHGPMAAAPLYVAALYVGHTRVAARRHRWVDIAGAALVSEAAASWLVRSSNGTRVEVTTFLDRGYVGASLAMQW